MLVAVSFCQDLLQIEVFQTLCPTWHVILSYKYSSRGGRCPSLEDSHPDEQPGTGHTRSDGMTADSSTVVLCYKVMDMSKGIPSEAFFFSDKLLFYFSKFPQFKVTFPY